jgi:diguanylate cyclase (GGDEF)-like protein
MEDAIASRNCPRRPDPEREREAAPEWDELLLSTFDLAVSFLEARWCALFLIHGPEKKLELADLWARDRGLATGSRRVSAGEAEHRVVEFGEPLVAVRAAREWLSEGRGAATEELCPGVCVPVESRGERLGAVSLIRGPLDPAFLPKDLQIARMIGRQIACGLRSSALYRRSIEMANTDGLTGLYNHRYFQNRIEVELERSARYKRFLSLVMLDIDGLKQYNDMFGHPQGDIALRQLAATIERAVRRIDIVARYGGDEFAIIFPETAGAQALKIATRIVRAANSQPRIRASAGRATKGLSISVGVSSFPVPATSKDELIQQADDALYMVKSGQMEHAWLWEASPGAAVPERPVY